MKLINFTQKDIPILIQVLFSELLLISSFGLIEKKHRYTTKFRELQEKLEPIADDIHSVGKHLDYCFDKSSSIKPNETAEIKDIIVKLLLILENLEEKSVKDGIDKIVADLKREEK